MKYVIKYNIHTSSITLFGIEVYEFYYVYVSPALSRGMIWIQLGKRHRNWDQSPSSEPNSAVSLESQHIFLFLDQGLANMASQL